MQKSIFSTILHNSINVLNFNFNILFFRRIAIVVAASFAANKWSRSRRLATRYRWSNLKSGDRRTGAHTSARACQRPRANGTQSAESHFTPSHISAAR